MTMALSPPQEPNATPESEPAEETPATSTDDTRYALAIHLSTLTFVAGLGPVALVTPLILWLLRKDASDFIDDHGREVLNAGLSYTLYSLLLFWTGIIPLVLFVVAIVSIIRAAIAADSGEYFRYPITIRIL